MPCIRKKIAVIGFGFMGVVHAKNIIENDKLELCAIIDNRDNIFDGIENTGNKGTLDLPIDKLKQVHVYKTLEECVEKEQPDAVSICVPLFMHYEFAQKALNHGLDVLLEKPFCPEVSQCRELIELAKEKNKILMVAHCLRFRPAWKFMAECIKNQCYGKLKMLSMTRKGGMPTWGIWKDLEIRKTCGGGLWDLLIHDIDFTNHHIGIPGSLKVNVNVDDYWETSFEKDGSVVSIKGGFLHPHAPFEAEYFATFENASLQYSTKDLKKLYISSIDGLEEKKVEDNCYFDEMDYFAECIIERQAPLECLPEEAMRAIEICVKAGEGK